MLDEVGIIHMNGRIYDAKLGRFLQADPFIDKPYDTQMLNRYSYVRNNPLNAVDPSGYFVTILVGIMVALAKVELVIAAIAVGIAAFLETLVMGGDLGDALLAGVSAGALTFAGLALFPGSSAEIGQLIAFGLKMGVIGGITTAIQGGKFGHGFFAAGFGSFVGAKIGGFVKGAGNTLKNLGKFMAKVTVGGSISKATGGKFANGAGYAAFSAAVSYAAAPEPTSNNRHLNNAIKHLNKSEAFENEFSKAKKFGVKIEVNSEISSHFDHETNTVQWNPLEGNNIEAGVSSPATSLAHEITHAVKFNELGLQAFEASLEAPVLSTDYSIGNDGIPEIKVVYGVSQEEIRATNFERAVQSQLGEPLRLNYRDAGSINVISPTYFCYQGTEGCR